MKNHRINMLRFRWRLIIMSILAVTLSCGGDKQTEVRNDLKELSVDRDELIALIGQDFLIDDQHSYIGFKIKYFGFSPVRGRFDNFNGTVFYDPENLGALSVSVNIDVSSINTGVEMRDQDLQTDGPGWFNVKDYPQISFVSDKVLAHGDDTFTLEGNLTINGITKSIAAHFTNTTPMSKDLFANDQVDFSGKLVLNRMDFGVSGGDFWSKVMENGVTQLSHDVEIEIDIHTRRTDYLERMASEDSSNVRVIIPQMVNDQGISEAIMELRRLKALPENPVSSGALSTIGYTLVAQNKLDDAQMVFELRQELFPGRISSHNQLGIVSLKKGAVQQAQTFFRQAIAQDSTDSRAMEYIKLIAKIDR